MTALFLAAAAPHDRVLDWTAAEMATLQSLWIGNLPALPASPGNPVADDPRAVALGHRLFFDPQFSANGEVACATCHQPAMNFKDGLPKARGMGETRRRTMTVVGAAYSPWLFWDGRRDSLWAQALSPMENSSEHGGTRTRFAQLLADNAAYGRDYEALFGLLPNVSDSARFPPNASPTGDPEQQTAWRGMADGDRDTVSVVFANLGRALEAYQRRLMPAAAPFDRYVEALADGDTDQAATELTLEQQDGLRLFIGKAQCIHCHNGPLFTNNEFHNTGLFPPDQLPEDRGRMTGVQELLADEFNCLGSFSGAEESDCAELRFVKSQGIELVAAFRAVTLRNVASTGPFMHNGQFTALGEVLRHYNKATMTIVGNELTPLQLSEAEMASLEAFLHSLEGPLATPSDLLEPP